MSQDLDTLQQELHYFVLKRGFGGHAQDGDCFIARLAFKGLPELVVLLSKLGLVLEEIPPTFPRPIPGKSYNFEEFAVFKSEIVAFPNFAQPGYVTLNGQFAFLWVFDDHVEVFVSGTLDGNLYEVSAADVATCKIIEALFVKQGL